MTKSAYVHTPYSVRSLLIEEDDVLSIFRIKSTEYEFKLTFIFKSKAPTVKHTRRPIIIDLLLVLVIDVVQHDANHT